MPAEHLLAGHDTSDVLLATEVGSRAYGTATETSDHDVMGLYLESAAQTYGLAQPKTRQTVFGRRSSAGDVDVTLHPLRKAVSLMHKANPTVLVLLHTPPENRLISSAAAEHLIAHRDLFLSQQLFNSHIGYGIMQLRAMRGEGGRKQRTDLVAAHGYDVKFAMHVLRVLHQGIELATQGTYTLPIQSPVIELLRAVRAGSVPQNDVEDRAETLIAELEQLAATTSLPEYPDFEATNRLLIELHHIAVENDGMND